MSYNFAREQDARRTVEYIRKAYEPSGVVSPNPHGREVGICMTPTGGIPARSGADAGSAECNVYYLGSDGELSDSGNKLTVWNMFSSDIGGDTYIQVSWVASMAVVSAEDC